MITSFQPSKVLILVLAACFAWIGGISVVVALVLGKGASVGWIVAGALVFALVVWLPMMFREVRRAMELPDYLSAGEYEPDLARTRLDYAVTLSRTGMGNLSFGRSAMGVRKAASRPRCRARSKVAASPNFEADR